MSENVRLPDFLIIGTMKSGTTTLADYLSEHPRICIPAAELQFFNNDANFAKGPLWYSQKLTDGCTRDDLAQAQVGEKTPTYSYDPKCLPRIKQLAPHVKLIWIFRNPVQRTYSNYLHRVKRGSELASFRSAVAKEKEARSRDIWRGYVERSKYVDQVERFLDSFPIEQMHFMLFEDLLTSRKEELDKVAGFLGLEPFATAPAALASNITSMPVSPVSLWLVRRLFGRVSLPFRLVHKVNYLYARDKPKMPRDLQEQLAVLFEPYNERLAQLTGLDLSAWKSPAARKASGAEQHAGQPGRQAS